MDNCNCEQALGLKEICLELWYHTVKGTRPENLGELYGKVLELTKEKEEK